MAKKPKKREPEKGETKAHEAKESKSFEKMEQKTGIEKRKRMAGQGTGKPTVGFVKGQTRVTPIKNQGMMVSPVERLRKAMKRVAKHG